MLNTILLQAAAGGSPYSSLIFIVQIIAVFYFFMIRPQQQQQKKLREERNNMQKGDPVITSGGLYGKIVGIKMGPQNKKGIAEVESFIISLKPDYTVTVQVSKECVFKDLNDVTAAQTK
jgi:preprotein translocase YajC subunit